jgi:DNA repair protein RecN (Recombination protein N)
MLRQLSIRNFVLVDALDVELAGGFAVLTGETGAGKSILVDALGLLLGDRFEPGQLRAGAARAELAATFATADLPQVSAWLAEHDFEGDEGEVLLRRVLDAQGRSRAYVNGHPATLAQLAELGERLVDLHGQHAHQSLGQAEAQRALVDAFGGFATLAREVAAAWRAWRTAVERRDAAQWRRAPPRPSASSCASGSASSQRSPSPRRSGPTSTPRNRASRTPRR